ncbi:unnamed protein product [Merluccius merluccius]
MIRRLYLKWHPDKNSENLDIATEVFKHLQNEINRMEKQSLSDQQNTDRASRRTFATSSTRFQSEKFSFQRFYTSWNQEATSHNWKPGRSPQVAKASKSKLFRSQE